MKAFQYLCYCIQAWKSYLNLRASLLVHPQDTFLITDHSHIMDNMKNSFWNKAYPFIIGLHYTLKLSFKHCKMLHHKFAQFAAWKMLCVCLFIFRILTYIIPNVAATFLTANYNQLFQGCIKRNPVTAL